MAVASLDRQTNSLDELRSGHDAVERRDRVIGHLELALPTAAARGRALKSAGYAFREQLHRDVSSVRRPETAGPGAGCIREWKIEGVGGGAG